MAEYNLGTARGKIKVDYEGDGVKKAKADLGGVEGAAGKTSKGLQKTGQAAGVAGGAMALGLGLAAKVAVDFEKQISAIGAVSGASAADLDKFRAKALQLGADTSFGASEAALAMEELAKAGLSTTDILNGAADAAVALAAAGGVELAEAAELSADAMTSFGLAASDLPGIADQIAGAANASSINVSQFGQSLKQVGAVANLTGISFEDTAAAIALMGANGIKGSDAGTSLKTMLSNLIPSTDKARQVMKELGIITKDGSNAFIDAAGNMKPLADISEILQTSTSKLTAAEKQLALETIFGSDAIRAAAILTKSGAEGFNDMATAMGKVTAEEVAAARLDNTAGAIEQLKGSAETAAIGLAQALLPAITKVAKVITSVTNSFNQLDQGTKNTITTVALIVTGLLLLVFVVTKIIAVAQSFIAVWRLLNLAFITSPIGLLIAGILILVGVIILIATKTDWFQRIWAAAWGWIKDAAGAVADWFTGTIVPSLKRAIEQLVTFYKTMFNFWKTVFEGFLGYIMFWVNLVVGIFKIVWAGIKLYWEFVGNVIRAVIDFIVASFAFWLGKVKATIEAVRTTVSRVANFFRDMKEGAEKWIRALISVVTSIPGRVRDAVGNLGRILYNKGRDIVQGLIDGLRSMLGRVKDAAGSIVNAVTDWLPGSPAKVGPLSGQGYALRRGQRMADDFASGILSGLDAARVAASSLVGEASAQLPTSSAAPVATATAAAAAPAQTRPLVVQAAGGGGAITIERIDISGATWDLSDPDVPRRFVARLHDELDRYRKEHR